MAKCLSNYTLKGILDSCDSNIGGVEVLWAGYHGDFNITVDEATHTVSAMTSASTKVSGKLYEYHFNKGAASMTSTLTVNEDSGSRYYTNVASMQVARLRADLYLELEALASEKLIVIVKDNNGICHLFDPSTYAKGSNETAQTGQSFDELNGATIEISQTAGHLPYVIDYSKFSAFIDTVTPAQNA